MKQLRYQAKSVMGTIRDQNTTSVDESQLEYELDASTMGIIENLGLESGETTPNKSVLPNF